MFSDLTFKEQNGKHFKTVINRISPQQKKIEDYEVKAG